MTNKKILFYMGLTLLAVVSLTVAIGLGSGLDAMLKPTVQAGEFKTQEFTCVSVVDSGKDSEERRDCIVALLDLSTAWLADHITDVELGPTRYTIGIEYRDVEP